MVFVGSKGNKICHCLIALMNTYTTKAKHLISYEMFQMPSKESIETLSALEIAEQMTYLDHQIFVCIRSE